MKAVVTVKFFLDDLLETTKHLEIFVGDPQHDLLDKIDEMRAVVAEFLTEDA